MEDFWYGMEMEWKKIASMEYGKIVFHSISYHVPLLVISWFPYVDSIPPKGRGLQFSDYIGS